MIRRHMFAFRLTLLATDSVIAVLVFLVMGELRFGDAKWTTVWQAMDIDALVGAVLYAAAWVTILWALGLYAFRGRWSLAGELSDVLVGSLVMAFGTMTFLYLVSLDVSRVYLGIIFVGPPLITMASRLALRSCFDWLHRRGYNRCYMVVIGIGDEAQAFADTIERHHELGIQVIGHLRAPDEDHGVATRPILGDVSDLGRVFHERVVDEVALCAGVGADDAEWAQPIIRLAADEGKHVRVPSTAPPRPLLDLQTEELEGMFVRSYVHGPTRMLSLAVKRAMDVAGAAVGLVLISPVVAIVAIAIVVTDGRPVYYHQTRVGLHGRLFTVHKFRTMTRDAESRLDEVRPLNRISGPAIQVDNDPRVTSVGAFLRKTSVDELPQLWNVLTGEMSLVGPRPAPMVEVAAYDIWHRRRLSMRPGITGLAQVTMRKYKHFDERADLDLRYLDQWSLALDGRVLFRTIGVVFGMSGR